MTMDERVINGHIADALNELAPPGYAFKAERHSTARKGHTVPDILVTMPYGLRSIIELEYNLPALGDAKAKTGYEFRDVTNLPLKSVIALGIPKYLGDIDNPVQRRAALKTPEPQFLMQIVTGTSPENITGIVPEEPLLVSLQDLVQYCWLTAIPEDYSREKLNEIIAELTAAQKQLIKALESAPPEIQGKIIAKYNPDNETQLAGAVGNIIGTLSSMTQLHLSLKKWASAITSQVKPLAHPDLWQAGPPYDALPYQIAREWRLIEDIDYEPLSTLAAEMMEDQDLSSHLGPILRVIHQTLEKYIISGIAATTNVAAEVWQSLIPDRDQRAAYYTKPATAEILTNLTIPCLAGDFSSVQYNEICAGTGTLARATEENLRFRHYAGVEPPADGKTPKPSIHATRMEEKIQLTDLNPQSISVATANMASLEPETPFKSSKIFAIATHGGAMNYLSEKGIADMSQKLRGSHGELGAMVTLLPNTAGLCCNNDPYFRPRGGAASPIDSKAMKAYKAYAEKKVKGVVNGQAGLATFMHAIEHFMLADQAPHGKVLPLTAAHAESWKGFRKNFENEYKDIIAVCTAAGDGASMSADTTLQEMLLIGVKTKEEQADPTVTCVNLTQPFATRVEAKIFADAIRQELAAGKEEGQITLGSSYTIGTYYRMTDLGQGKPWSALGSSGSFTILTDKITKGYAWNPATNKATPFALPMTTLSGVSAKGPTHHLLGCIPASRDPRGAFTMIPKEKAESFLNPSLWGIDAEIQTAITVQPTHYGKPRSTPEEAERMLETAGNFHISRGLGSAQKIAVAYTETPCMGSSSYTTLYTKDPTVIKAITMFLNSTYGLLIRIGYGQTTMPGRMRIQVKAIDDHPIPDFNANTPEALNARQIAENNFERLRQIKLDRIALAAIDKNRKEIDQIVTEMLGLPWNISTENMLDNWRRLMCQQPTIHANNQTVLKALKQHKIIPSE